jgi:hypothetical protein
MTRFENELGARFGALADTRDDGSWADVVGRARELRKPRRRGILSIAAALVLAVVLAAPAVGLHGKLVRLFSDAEPAPQRIERSFAALDEGVPPGLGSGVQPHLARKVLATRVSSDATAILWLAPTTQGGFCTLLDLGGRGGGGECLRLRPTSLSVTVSLHGRVSSDGEVLTGPVLLDGFAAERDADSLVLRFEDGASARIPLVWVSAPVQTGFFVYGVREQHWRTGHLPTTLTLLDAGGDELARRDVTGIPTP